MDQKHSAKGVFLCVSGEKDGFRMTIEGEDVRAYLEQTNPNTFVACSSVLRGMTLLADIHQHPGFIEYSS
jgi:hypothetical protein